MGQPKPDYYTGDLHARFNSHWEAMHTPGNREITDAWAEFTRLLDADTRVRTVRRRFYSPDASPLAYMSRNAYYRWKRSYEQATERSKT